MRTLAHRGLWHQRSECNTLPALTAALVKSHGIEFDVRDHLGQLVIAHDIATKPMPAVVDLFTTYRPISNDTPIAINVKADGLATHIAGLISSHSVTNYSCFDMSVPEMLHYRRMRVRYFTRHSEHEPAPVLYADAVGVWMDMFESDWIEGADIRSHLDNGKQVAVVSPELHGRPHLAFWERLRKSGLARHPELMLCTDHPDAARSFFHD